MASHNLEGHFNASDPAPPVPTYSSLNEDRWTTADKDKNLAYLPLARKWKHDEHIARAQLAQVVSDSLLIWIQHAGSVADMWKRIVTKFDHKGCMVQVDLRHKMMEKRVSKMDDIRVHLDDMALSHEHLSGMGIAIHDEDYASMVLMSLPDSYTMYLETLTDAAISSGCTFPTPDFIAKAIKLADKRQLRASCDPKSSQKDSAFHTSDGCNKSKKGNLSKKDIECFNCHKRGTSPATVMGLGEPKKDNIP